MNNVEQGIADRVGRVVDAAGGTKSTQWFQSRVQGGAMTGAERLLIDAALAWNRAEAEMHRLARRCTSPDREEEWAEHMEHASATFDRARNKLRDACNAIAVERRVAGPWEAPRPSKFEDPIKGEMNRYPAGDDGGLSCAHVWPVDTSDGSESWEWGACSRDGRDEEGFASNREAAMKAADAKLVEWEWRLLPQPRTCKTCGNLSNDHRADCRWVVRIERPYERWHEWWRSLSAEQVGLAFLAAPRVAGAWLQERKPARFMRRRLYGDEGPAGPYAAKMWKRNGKWCVDGFSDVFETAEQAMAECDATLKAAGYVLCDSEPSPNDTKGGPP